MTHWGTTFFTFLYIFTFFQKITRLGNLCYYERHINKRRLKRRFHHVSLQRSRNTNINQKIKLLLVKSSVRNEIFHADIKSVESAAKNQKKSQRPKTIFHGYKVKKCHGSFLSLFFRIYFLVLFRLGFAVSKNFLVFFYFKLA